MELYGRYSRRVPNQNWIEVLKFALIKPSIPKKIGAVLRVNFGTHFGLKPPKIGFGQWNRPGWVGLFSF